MPDITVDLNQTKGTIKKLHGVNNGPVTYGSLVNVTKYYQKVEIPLVRLHDPNWPHPREVDIHLVFPDFDKDPDDPKNYDFSKTDEYIRTVINTGAQVLYRLGESIEHTDKKYYVHPPKDYEKWAKICLNIIRHYNEGWADGFHYDIQYWEVWNEPDYSLNMWSGTAEDYYNLYEVTAGSIKKHFPHLKVGGPAVARSYQSDFVQGFLEFVRERSLPLDFFSWHTYTSDVKMIERNAKHVRNQLDHYGFTNTESHFNEWNYFESEFNVIWKEESEYIRRRTFERAKSEVGASFVAAVLSVLQDSSVDQANYYDGQPTAVLCGLFDYYGVPQKAYSAFEAFHQLTLMSERVESSVEDIEGLYCLAAKNNTGSSAIMVSNYEAKSKHYTIKVDGLEKRMQLEVYITDHERNFQQIEKRELDNADIKLWMPKHSVLLLQMNPIE